MLVILVAQTLFIQVLISMNRSKRTCEAMRMIARRRVIGGCLTGQHSSPWLEKSFLFSNLLLEYGQFFRGSVIRIFEAKIKYYFLLDSEYDIKF